eukprot:COSAG02_NODE_5264_length_4487_cov_1.615998_4_plen_62_part_00
MQSEASLKDVRRRKAAALRRHIHGDDTSADLAELTESVSSLQTQVNGIEEKLDKVLQMVGN